MIISIFCDTLIAPVYKQSIRCYVSGKILYGNVLERWDPMVNSVKKDLLINLEKIHTTELGEGRIKRNLELEIEDVVNWCVQKTKQADRIIRKGKNWYVYTDDAVITINAHSYTIITAHKSKG